MNPDSKRRFQLIIGFAIFVVAIALSYFSVVEADVQDTPQYDIYLVIDVSGSMGTLDVYGGHERIIITDDSPIVFAKQAAIEFVDMFQLDKSSVHRIGLAIFHGDDYAPPTPKSEILVNLENNSENLKEGIDKLYPGGATAMGEGILIATESLSENTRPDTEKVIVLLSDGVSNAGLDPLSAAGLANENDVTIFSIGYGDAADVQTLKAVASLTNGKYYNALTGQELAGTFNQIADVLISPLSHYSSRILILIAIPVLLFIPTIERGIATIMRMSDPKPPERMKKERKNVKRPEIMKTACTECNYLNNSTSKFCGKCGKPVKGNGV